MPIKLKVFFAILILVAVVEAQNAEEKKAAIVVDYSSNKKVLYTFDADKGRYPASLTKMMTLYILLDSVKRNRLALTTKFCATKNAVNQAPCKMGLKVGEKISVSDAIKALMVKSANDVAVVVAEGIAGDVKNFCRLMNKKCNELGMTNTHFENPSGLPNTKQVSTARDMVKLGIALYRDFPKYRHFFSIKQFSYGKKKYKTHCKILHWYKGADVAKTGYICASGYNLLVSANRYGKDGKSKRLFVVVMGGDTAKARDIYAGQLMDKYFDKFNMDVKGTTTQQSLKARNGKSEMLDEIVKAESEVLIKNEQANLKFKKMLDDLYKEDDECLPSEEEFVINPPKKNTKQQRKKQHTTDRKK